ncbi:MAG: M48 family metalloprotease [Gammaproteobacteria bacterium]|nr:M48 family metalloprotease [Gammaproteobacteria bacterium]
MRIIKNYQKSRRFKKPITYFCALVLIMSFSLQAETNVLPELGDSATQYLSPKKEREIGQSFLRRLLINADYVSDHELRHYLQSIGDRVASAADLRGIPLTFNLIESNNLNAFAVPGGYITFNTGLLLNTEEESELASVVAHEIAHLSQLHLPRLLARSQDNKLPTTAAIIGSILLGGQIGLAGLTLTNAQLLSNQLRYTRDFEREADAVGIRLLSNAGFDPFAMTQFFSKLERYSRTQGSNTPEFLRTHPLSYSRIAETEQRAQQLPTVSHKSSLEFHLVRAKIQALYTTAKTSPIIRFKKHLPDLAGDKKTAALYGLALALAEDRRYEEAEETLKPLIESDLNNHYFQTLQASIEHSSDRSTVAIERLSKLYQKNPNLHFVIYYLVDTLIENKQLNNAKQLVRYQLRRRPDDYRLYKSLSKINVALSLIAQAHQADAEYYAVLGDNKKAIASLKLALRDNKTEGYFPQSITARIKELEEKIPEPNA